MALTTLRVRGQVAAKLVNRLGSGDILKGRPDLRGRVRRPFDGAGAPSRGGFGRGGDTAHDVPAATGHVATWVAARLPSISRPVVERGQRLGQVLGQRRLAFAGLHVAIRALGEGVVGVSGALTGERPRGCWADAR